MDQVLLRERVVDEKGLMRKPWVRQQTQVQAAAQQVAGISDSVDDLQAAGQLYDDRNPINYSPEIEGLGLTIDRPTRAYEDSDIRVQLAAGEPSRPLSLQSQIDELKAQLAAVLDPPRGGDAGTFTSADGKTITVRAGLIISIV